MKKFRLIDKKGEGTFSEVLLAQSLKTGKYVAIKCMKNHFDSIEQVNNFVEIQALRKLSPHPNIIKLLEALYDEPTGRLALVFELMDVNQYEAIKGKKSYIAEAKIKWWMYQLIYAVEHLHSKGIFHRDIKPENILQRDDTVKLADFGSCRGRNTKHPYTEYISTRWYRAPECLLTDGYYNCQMDIWGVACVWFEMLSLYPLFPGEKDEIDQINKIFSIKGNPPESLQEEWKKNASHIDFNFPNHKGKEIKQLLPHVSEECCDLIEKLLVYNPEERLTATAAKNHPYFRDLREIEAKRFRQISKRAGQRERESSQEHDSSVSSNHPPINHHNNTHHGNVSFINININANNSNYGNIYGNNMNININTKNSNNLPGLKSTLIEKGINRNTQISDESDVDLPPINQKKDYMLHLYQKRKKYMPSTDHSLTNLTVLNQIPTNKMSMNDKKKLQMKEQQKNYINPYSQKNSKGQINQNYD